MVSKELEKRIRGCYLFVKEMEDRGRCLNPSEIRRILKELTGEEPSDEISTAYGVKIYLEDKYDLKLE